MLSDRRDDLVRERTRTVNRLQSLLTVLSPGDHLSRATAAQAAELRRKRPQEHAQQVRRRIALDIVADIRTLDRRIADATRAIELAVEESQTTLVELFGIGPVLAAKILGHAGNVRRFPTKDHFASYTGTAPIEASSGEVVRHRLSRAGNRQLNHALYIMAICQNPQAHTGAGLLPTKALRRKEPEGSTSLSEAPAVGRRLPAARLRLDESDPGMAA